MRDELSTGGHVYSVDVWESHRGRSRGKDNAPGPGLSGHAHDLTARGAPNNRIIHDQDPLALELRGHGVELLADRLLADFLARHDKGAAHITILDEALAVRHIQMHGEL